MANGAKNTRAAKPELPAKEKQLTAGAGSTKVLPATETASTVSSADAATGAVTTATTGVDSGTGPAADSVAVVSTAVPADALVAEPVPQFVTREQLEALTARVDTLSTTAKIDAAFAADIPADATHEITAVHVPNKRRMRSGVVFTDKPQTVNQATFTPEQWAAIEADSHLKIRKL